MAEWIISYQVIESGSSAGLASAVADRIAEGWQPWGNPYASPDGHFQAVVRTQEGLARFENERRRQGEGLAPEGE